MRAEEEMIEDIAAQLADLLDKPVLEEVNEASLEAAMEWDEFALYFLESTKK